MKDRERHIDIMGIVNLTNDSYFEESRCGTDPRQMVRKALSVIEEMLEDGATIIDLGACSTRPGSVPVGAEEEWRRLRPVLKALATRCPEVRISIDTYHSSVIRSAFDLLSDI